LIEETAALIVSTERLVTIYGLWQPVLVRYHTRESDSCLCWILQAGKKC